jgi:hypothetical protein
MLHDVLRGTVPNNATFISGSDPTIFIRQGYRFDSKVVDMTKVSKATAKTPWGFINLKPEGPLFKK